MNTHVGIGLPGILLTIGMAAQPAAAQSVPVPPVYFPSAETDSMLVLVEIRALANIEHALEEAAAQKAAAEERVSNAKMLQVRANTKIRLKDAEIAALKAEIQQAKALKDEAMREDFENKRKFANLEIQLLKRRDQLRKNEIDLAQAEMEYHAAEVKGYQAELEFAHSRVRRASLDGAVSSMELFEEARKLAKEIHDAEGRTLDAKIEVARKQKNVATKAVEITKARKSVYEARRKLVETTGGG